MELKAVLRIIRVRDRPLARQYSRETAGLRWPSWQSSQRPRREVRGILIEREHGLEGAAPRVTVRRSILQREGKRERRREHLEHLTQVPDVVFPGVSVEDVLDLISQLS